MNYLELFKQLQETVGASTPESLEHLRSMQLDYENRKDPNSFYLTFSLSPPPRVTWSHNADHLLGVTVLDYEQFYTRIHPSWLPLYMGFGIAAYLMGRGVFGRESKEWASYTINVPLRHEDGSYHWYNQVTVPGTFDSDRKMVSHLNEYHRLCPFDRLIPSKPKMIRNDNWLMGFDQEFARAGNGVIDESLEPLLTAANRRIIKNYRRLASIREDGSWAPPAKKEVREVLGLSATAINKANVRIMQALKGAFPSSVTADVASFAMFLNDLCGHPDDVANK